MKLLTFLTLLPLTLGMALPVEKRDAPLPFEGLGQLIVTDWSHIDIGCLITTGEYTADFSKCATFTGFRKFTPGPPGWEDYGTTYWYLNSTVGYCGAPIVGPWPAVSPVICTAWMDPLLDSYWIAGVGRDANQGAPVLLYGKVDFTTTFQTLDGSVTSGDVLKQVTPVYGNNYKGGAKLVIQWKAV